MTIHVILESYEPPADVAAILLAEGGSNRFGRPNFRAVWTNSRLEWVKGDFPVLHQRPKYEHKPNRWVIECWCPPEIYAMGTWDESELGPFPEQGDYEPSFFVEMPDTEEFVSITTGICRAVIRRVLASKQHSPWERFIALKDREERKEKDADRIRHDIFSNSPKLYTGSYVNVK